MAVKSIKSELSTYKVLGPGQLTQSQILGIETSTPNLLMGHSYLIMPQISHSKEVEFNGEKRKSTRFAAFEFNPNGELVQIKTIGLSALRAAYVGVVTSNSEAPVIEAEIRNEGRANGLFRAKPGAASYVNTVNGTLPLAIKEVSGNKTAVINAPVVLNVKGRARYYQPIFTQESDGRYNMEVDDNMHLKLAVRTDYKMDVVDAEKFASKVDFKAMCPELADYIL